MQRAAERVTYRDVFAVSEFRALWVAQILSVAGDQLARVALTVLVYEKTRSALLAAVTYAASIVPVFLGGVLLSGLADRFSRKAVMILCDVIRVLLVATMALPGMPVTALVSLLFGVTMLGAPFTSARSAIYPDVLAGDHYVLGTAVTLTTYQMAQVLGFLAGGTIVVYLGTHVSLFVDAATFAASAGLIGAGVRARPVALSAARRIATPVRDAAIGFRLVFGAPALRVPMLFGWLSAFYNVPEGLAAPYARALHGGPASVGLILAAEALGASAGSVLFSRFASPRHRLPLMGPLAIGACGVLALTGLGLGLAGALAVLAVSGLCASFQVAANAAFVAAAPMAQRGQAFGLATAGMSLGQGAAMIMAGTAAERFPPAMVIATSGAAGAVCASWLTVRWLRQRR